MKNLFLLFVINTIIESSFASGYIVDNHIKIDQFGYRTGDKKIAVVSNPQTGYNAGTSFIAGTIYQVRRVSDDAVMFSNNCIAWNGGATHSQSGDKVWWFDFSSFITVGSYYVFDVANNVGSYPFDISDYVYETVMKQAMRMFYYQRCGFTKAVPYAQSGWTDVACHVGAFQDIDCRLYNDTTLATSKNLSEGWHDAGDYNKYVNFTFETMMDLLLAFHQNPTIWGDNYNIPESNNGIPDLLDEIKIELDWLLKMQQNDGSVLGVIGTQNYASGSPPSADHAQRLYGPATTSATFTVATLFALAAIEFQSVGQTTYSSLLRTSSLNAWAWATANPNVTFYNSGIIAAGEQEVTAYDLFIRHLGASVFLYALTGNNVYKNFVDTNYSQVHMLQWGYAYPFESAAQDMLLFYASLPNATASVSTTIKNAYRNSMMTGNTDNLQAYLNGTDAYRAYLSDGNYTWGSNTTKGRQGMMFMNMIAYHLDAANDSNYAGAALGFVNYFHGVNPTGFCYLSNMSAFGAENSINEFYHGWFTDGSALWDRVGVSTYGPAPGYVPGGPNPGYNVDGCCPTACGSPTNNALCNASLVTPPLNQPIQKSYRDWNADWPQDSWTVTEPAIYCQASYVRVLSWFLSNGCFATSINSQSENLYSSIRIFPNPIENKIIIDGIKDGAVIEIDNIVGEKVFEKLAEKTHQASVDVSSLSKGIYVVRVKDAEKIFYAKIVKE